jgi:hypothetical protein
MGMIEDIIDWAQTLALWQADAMRRLLSQDDLTRSDKNELYRILKSEYGLLAAGERSPQPVRPQRGVVSGVPSTQTKLTLHAIEAIRNVNAIPDGSALPFGVEGLTVIYGENATGKSGYARILKHACKARDTQERILSNVRVSQTIRAPASANIKVSVDDSEPRLLAWTDGVQPPEVLTNVAFFDSKCARIIVDEECDLSYLPYGADVFRRLGELMNEFKDHLQRERPSPTAPQIQGITAATKAAHFQATLSATTSDEETAAACAWSEMDDARLKELQHLIDSDPLQLASQLDTKIKRIDQLRKALEDAEATVSDAAISSINMTYDEVNIAEKALEIVAKEMTSEPLAGIGTNVWRQLYEAAKEYSIKLAYPGTEFPYTEAEARCVLCMQLLMPDATDRLNRFSKFMKDKTASEAEEVRLRFTNKRRTLLGSTIARIDQFTDVLETLYKEKPDLCQSIRSYLDEATPRLQALKAAVFPVDPTKILPLSACPANDIDAVIMQLSERAAKLRQQAQPEEQTKISKERDELQSRKALANRKKDLLSYVGELKLKEAYDRCMSSLNTRAVSDTGKRMIAGMFTPGFVISMKTELDKLGASYLDITPAPVAEAGETYHRFILTGMQRSTRADLSEILSEGELCVVAIAGFLAELAASGHKGPIVFDDPVCSLDHRYRDLIAKRIAAAAADRQVILFTHDISLLLGLADCAAADHRIKWAPFTVEKVGQSPGKVKEGHPSEAKSFNEQLNELLGDIDQIAPLIKTDMAEYNKQAAAVYDRLRGAVDSFIEKNLFNKTVMRYQSRVSIGRLDSVDCIDNDCTILQWAYTLCGRYGAAHANALPLDANRPAPADIKTHISKLRTYAQSVDSRREGMDKKRKTLRQPVRGKTG